jgi:hypothetical protein
MGSENFCFTLITVGALPKDFGSFTYKMILFQGYLHTKYFFSSKRPTLINKEKHEG